MVFGVPSRLDLSRNLSEEAIFNLYGLLQSDSFSYFLHGKKQQ
jgi:hypothetical protein